MEFWQSNGKKLHKKTINGQTEENLINPRKSDTICQYGYPYFGLSFKLSFLIPVKVFFFDVKSRIKFTAKLHIQ